MSDIGDGDDESEDDEESLELSSPGTASAHLGGDAGDATGVTAPAGEPTGVTAPADGVARGAGAADDSIGVFGITTGTE